MSDGVIIEGRLRQAPPRLKRQLFERRALTNRLLTVFTWGIALLGSMPLFSVIYMLLVQGGSHRRAPGRIRNRRRFGNAIVGTFVMVGLATGLSVPFGILAATYLAVLGPASRVADTSRFVAKTLTGFPSVLAGMFTYGILVIRFGYSAWAGGVALSVLMLPTVVLAAEEAMAQVPRKMTDAAFGMGCTRAQVTWKIILPTALPGIVTGVMLAVARAAGGSAPLLFTALFSNYYLSSLSEPTASLSILIFNFSAMPFQNQIELAWAASLVLALIVLAINILARLIGKPKL